MIVRTRVMDRAAFLLCWGGSLLKIEGKVPDNTFTVEVDPAIIRYEKSTGLIPYKKFCNMRKELKRKSRKQQGLPIRYMANSTGWILQDIARFKTWGPKKLPGTPENP
jgi:hypothetical protein